MNHAAKILKAARARIADPKHWTRLHSARNSNGEPCSSASDAAVRWCAYGAFASEDAWDSNRKRAEGELEKAAREICPRAETPVIRLNDFHGHDAVLRAFDRAIELAEGSK